MYTALWRTVMHHRNCVLLENVPSLYPTLHHTDNQLPVFCIALRYPAAHDIIIQYHALN